MKNNGFGSKKTRERNRKLKAVLRTRTNNALSGEQIGHILRCVIPRLQYTIDVYTDPVRFCDALALGDTVDQGRIVFTKPLFGVNCYDLNAPEMMCQEPQSAAVVVARRKGISPADVIRTIHIYVPDQLYKKGS